MDQDRQRDLKSADSATVRAFAKLNLALDLIAPRADGFTEIATVFQTIDLHDTLRFRIGAGAGEITLRCDDPEIPAGPENLIWRALELYFQEAGIDRAIEVDLQKRIPHGAGLGGGSSDAAATLWFLESRFGALGWHALERLAARLGSDLNFFLQHGTALGEGRGERITPVPELRSYSLVLVSAGGSLATSEVYRVAREALTVKGGSPNISRLLAHLREGRSGFPPLANDLRVAAASLRPEIDRLVGVLAAQGGTAEMSGSGSVVFGMFESEDDAARAATAVRDAEPGARIWRARTLSRDEAQRRRMGD